MLPKQNLHSTSRLVEEDEKHWVKQRDLDVQFYQSGEAINGSTEADGLGVEIDFIDVCIGTHYEVLAPEKNREHSIGDHVVTLNVGFMEHLQTNCEALSNAQKDQARLHDRISTSDQRLSVLIR